MLGMDGCSWGRIYGEVEISGTVMLVANCGRAEHNDT